MPRADWVSMTTDESRVLLLPDDYSEFAWEVEAKGVFPEVAVRVGDKIVGVTFYDPVRLRQDVESELLAGRNFAINRLLVVPKVNLAEMRAAINTVGSEFLE